MKFIKHLFTELERGKLKDDCSKLKLNTEKLKKKYENLIDLLEKKEFSKTKREMNPTTEQMIENVSSSTHYRRRNETKNILQYIHGGSEGAVYGAWDFLTNSTSYEDLERFLLKFKKGKFIEKLQGKFSTAFNKSDVAVKKALATKYASYLSRRKYTFICKIQKSVFASDGDGVAHPVDYAGHKLDLKTAVVSHKRVEEFAKSIDIGEIHVITGYSGVARTVSTLVSMITDLHLTIPSLKKNLLWFNSIEDHFVVEFSDDGAPESRETTMSIGSLTLWNFGGQIRSRQFHYSLHMINAQEKDVICESLWRQHTDEMMLIESNVLNVNGKKTTFEFQPSADQAWQIWANNVLPASSTYPSPYANVHKGDLKQIGGSIGTELTSTWVPPIYSNRKKEIDQLTKFRSSLSISLSDETKHRKELEYMATKGIRQLGEPRIGVFCDRQKPDPLHLEINSWQHVLNVIYLEAVRRGQFDTFYATLATGKSKNGCGLKFVADHIKEHYDSVSTRMKSLTIRLIGAQAINLAQYSYRLLDTLEIKNESNGARITRLALSKICEVLRDIGSFINRVTTIPGYTEKIKELCMLYFNLFALFFPKHSNVTVWTLGYVVPYYAKQVFENYGIGYGILTMQGKEAKHSSIKNELKMCSNRSNAQDQTGKWYQLMRSSFIRNFYLPYHLPSLSSSYNSHFRSRIPYFDNEIQYCCCSRILNGQEEICFVCRQSAVILENAKDGTLSNEILVILKPVACTSCPLRFADRVTLDSHLKQEHGSKFITNKLINPANLNLNQLREELKSRKLSASGNKEILRRRLEGALAL